MTLSLPAPRHLFVRLPNPLGDAVMATPALRALRAALPDTRITWGGGGAVQAALAGLTARDAVLPVAGRLAKGWRAPLRLAKLLRTIAADAALLLPNSASSALAARAARIPLRIGTSLRRRGWLLSHVVDVPLTPDGKLVPRHMVDHYLDLVAPFGAKPDGDPPRLVVEPFDDERALRRLGDAAARPLLGVNPGAAFGSSKCYPPEHIARAVAALRTTRDVLPIVLCGPGEEGLAAQVQQAIGDGCLSTHDAPPDVGELKALLARVAVLLTTDAGPRHVAEALATPTVVWMGPTDPRWGGGGGRIVRNEDLACLACHFQTCPMADHPCMHGLDPAKVAAAAAAVWKAPADAPDTGTLARP